MAKATLEKRFLEHIDRRGPDECWPWTGSITRQGYGQFQSGGDAHRWAYKLFVGPIPQRHDIDHDCHNRDLSCPGGWSCPHRRCVNYERHLVPATRSANTKRGGTGKARGAQMRARTHCPAGHPYDEANTYLVQRRGTIERRCRECGRIKQREYQARRRLREGES